MSSPPFSVFPWVLITIGIFAIIGGLIWSTPELLVVGFSLVGITPMGGDLVLPERKLKKSRVDYGRIAELEKELLD